MGRQAGEGAVVMAAVAPHILHSNTARLFLLSRNLHNPASDFCSAPRPSQRGRYRDQRFAVEFTRVLKNMLAQSSLTPFRDTRFGQTPAPWRWMRSSGALHLPAAISSHRRQRQPSTRRPNRGRRLEPMSLPLRFQYLTNERALNGAMFKLEWPASRHRVLQKQSLHSSRHR